MPSPTLSNAELSRWLASAQGRYVTDWELAKTGPLVADVFGYHAVQIGLPELNFLAENRMPARHKLGDQRTDGRPERIDLAADPSECPLAENSVDLLVLAHALEFHPQPQRILREAERVLIPEGRLVIIGFNPLSLWGARRRLPQCPEGAPWNGHYLALTRLKDWLALLGFEIERGHFGRYAPPFKNPQWYHRWRWIEKAGDRWWPIAGGVYIIRAVKRIQGMRLLTPGWKSRVPAVKALGALARKEQGTTFHGR